MPIFMKQVSKIPFACNYSVLQLFLWRERFVHLFARTANQNQYLVLKYCNGKIEHHPGLVSKSAISACLLQLSKYFQNL